MKLVVTAVQVIAGHRRMLAIGRLPQPGIKDARSGRGSVWGIMPIAQSVGLSAIAMGDLKGRGLGAFLRWVRRSFEEGVCI